MNGLVHNGAEVSVLSQNLRVRRRSLYFFPSFPGDLEDVWKLLSQLPMSQVETWRELSRDSQGAFCQFLAVCPH